MYCARGTEIGGNLGRWVGACCLLRSPGDEWLMIGNRRWRVCREESECGAGCIGRS